MQKYLRPQYLIPAIVLFLIALPTAWYLLSPLFINVQVNESLPASARAVQTREPPAMQTAVADRTMHPMNEAMPAAAPRLIKQADFYNVVHEGKGKAEFFKLSDGTTILRLEDFQVLNGPELHVYLVPTADVQPNIGQDIPGSVDLGKLKGNQGAQNYNLPSNINIEQFRSVVIWCQPFKVPFIAATFP